MVPTPNDFDPNKASATEMGIAVYHESFHQGVVGIVAGRYTREVSTAGHRVCRRVESSDELKAQLAVLTS